MCLIAASITAVHDRQITGRSSISSSNASSSREPCAMLPTNRRLPYLKPLVRCVQYINAEAVAGGPIFPRFFYYVELSKDLYKSWPTVLGHPPGPVIATCECISTFIVTYKTNPLQNCSLQ